MSESTTLVAPATAAQKTAASMPSGPLTVASGNWTRDRA
jgi:hypothetical protein